MLIILVQQLFHRKGSIIMGKNKKQGGAEQKGNKHATGGVDKGACNQSGVENCPTEQKQGTKNTAKTNQSK